ncbi:hypothetical protein [Cylindrospermum sp. FACHB-282]|uniref:hypothetical protein n=1 Tax=Cylindrospermum sp. FACHB-282 TaxID=2692794 RepID=UPI001686E07A|nr:hypothetical protein [Cylindrospermum sp. FACHB-282]MBD2385594.1 hypothetical protein [Cylindrospermum sp. FACHB-282]
MNIGKTKLHPQRLLLCLGVVCGVLGVVSPDTVSSQTIPVRIVRVTATGGTTFKLRDSWYQQASQISNDKKCSVRQGEKFFVSSIRRSISNSPTPPKGNSERIGDYWEVTFEQPLSCDQLSEGKPTWFVYKKHIQELKTVVVP